MKCVSNARHHAKGFPCCLILILHNDRSRFLRNAGRRRQHQTWPALAPAPPPAAELAPFFLPQLPAGAARAEAPALEGLAVRGETWTRLAGENSEAGCSFRVFKVEKWWEGACGRGGGRGLRKERWLFPRVRAWSGAPGWTGGLGRMH